MGKLTPARRLLEALVDIQHWVKHDIDEPCGGCLRFDELQGAAMELINELESVSKNTWEDE